MRKTLFLIAFGAMIAPMVVSAQDADRKVAGGGELPPGWQTRIDPRAGSGTPAKFVVMGNGLHATSGSRAIYWRPADVGTGNYKVEATFTLTKPPDDAEPELHVLHARREWHVSDQAPRRRRRVGDSHDRELDAERRDREGGRERQEHRQARGHRRRAEDPVPDQRQGSVQHGSREDG